ncbi:hypothetical protein HF521_009838 [Silurus meridionalis]|uniref:WDR11 first beta-propeller domain-containing protein n=1 Tax=Silurus meridionalis TaxID=175797 RepID=A0A8T0BYZ6_SILME|nr:hypothetical protein HF521_009838 [Silurus meridionalis]
MSMDLIKSEEAENQVITVDPDEHKIPTSKTFKVMIPYTVNIKLAARTLTGTLNLQNKTAVDWGWQGLIAQGCHSSILVIDPNTAQTIQVLERHKANVVKVKWSRENYHHNLSSPYSLRLASADAAGKIIVWDVVSGMAHCEIQEHSKPIQDFTFLQTDMKLTDFMNLHPSSLVLTWSGSWYSMLKNLLETESTLLLTCVFPSSLFSSSGKVQQPQVLNLNTMEVAEAVTLNDCLQLSYMPSKKSHMLLLYPREILILDLELSQTVGVVAIERSGVPFIQVIPCAQRDALYCLHENGCITLRVCRSTALSAEEPAAVASEMEQGVQELSYDLRSQCDAIRVTKTVRPYRAVICPVNENRAALVVSDGRIMLWELKAHVGKASNPGSGLSPLYSPVHFCGTPLGQNQKRIPDLSLNTMIGPTLISGVDPPYPQWGSRRCS